MNIDSIKARVEDLKASAINKSSKDRSQFSKDLVITDYGTPRSFKEILHAIKGRAYSLPVVGRLMRWCIVMLRIHVRIEQLNERIEQLHERLAAILIYQGRQGSQLAKLRHYNDKESNPRFDYLTHYLAVVRNEIADLRSALASSQQRPLVSSPGGTEVVQENVDLGRLYVQFEERFRASSDALLKGFEEYRPHIEALPLPVKSLPCLDVGCGRGEWLSYLRKFGFNVVGVDSNGAMVEAAIAQGIDAHKDDGMNFLAKQKSGSISVVSAFHVVEHLPLGALLRLLEESYRVLAQGGIAIFETPNPENLLVGACNFYTDPTHKNPIPPHTLDFLVLQKGFAKTAIIRKGVNELPVTSTDPAVNYLLDWFRKEQDYAVVAFKV